MFSEIEFRLAGGNNVSFGRVEVAVDGEWGTICDYHFSTQEADVMCRYLGLYSGVAYVNSHYGAGTGKRWLFGLEVSDLIRIDTNDRECNKYSPLSKVIGSTAIFATHIHVSRGFFLPESKSLIVN